MNEGWKCPVCEKGNAPHANKCGHCAQGVTFPQPNLRTWPYSPPVYLHPFGPPPESPYWDGQATWITTDNTN